MVNYLIQEKSLTKSRPTLFLNENTIPCECEYVCVRACVCALGGSDIDVPLKEGNLHGLEIEKCTNLM